MYKFFFFFILLKISLGFSSNFSLDKFNIEINSNFLGEEVIIFGKKDPENEIIIIFEGEKKDAFLNVKSKNNLLWKSDLLSLNDTPNFFAIFSAPKKSLNEIFLISEIKNNHSLISDHTERLYRIRSAMYAKELFFENSLTELDGDLFINKFQIPDNISAGDIDIHLYEVNNNILINHTIKKLKIQKKGVSHDLETLLKSHSLIYVLILVIFSIFFSVLSNFIFRKK